jgi:FtsZ-binding cell division protein ZapB
VAFPMLEGEFADSPPPANDELREENSQLRDELRATRQERDKLKGELASITSSVRAIRDQLTPLHRALRGLFGEIDFVAPPSSSASSIPPHYPVGTAGLRAEAWETWKRKLGGKQAEFIQAFLDHGEMTQIQLKIATHSGTSTVPLILDKLQKLGLVSKNGGKYSLKEL